MYLTKKQLIDRINVWLKYDAFTDKVGDLLNIGETPDPVCDLEWFFRSDLITAIILKEMEVTDIEQAGAMADQIESFELDWNFHDLIYIAQREGHDAEWVYDNLVEQWYGVLEEAKEYCEMEEEKENNE